MLTQKPRLTGNPLPIASGRNSITLPQNRVVRFLKALNERLTTVLEWPLKYLFGRDIFISYSRKDAANYAQQLAIDLRTRVPKFSFYLDQWASLSGTTLPAALNRALRWSELLVVIGTENAMTSPSVRMELEVFFHKRGRFVPIDVNGVLEKAMQQDEFLAAICGPGAVKESSENIKNSTPSDAVITRIVNAVNFTRQDRRLRRAVIRTTLGVLAVIATAFFLSRAVVTRAQATAKTAYDQAVVAKEQAAVAKEEQGKALNDMVQSTVAAAAATAEQLLARVQAQQANEEAKLADTKRMEAEGLRDKARTEATKQGEIATSRLLANRAEIALRRSPDQLAQSTELAIESMRRADALGIHSLEADTALRRALSLIPRSRAARSIEGDITAVALSPDGEYMAAYGAKTSSGASDNLLRIQSVADGRVIATKPNQGYFVALSSGALRVAIADQHTVHTSDISGSGKWDLTLQNEGYSITGLALSPDGKHLALTTINPSVRHDACVVEIWEVETGKRLAQLDTEGAIYSSSISYSANGHLLAIGGVGKGPRGKPINRGLVWNIVPQKDGTISSESFGRPDQLLNQGMGVIAPGIDDRYVATAALKTAVVWKKLNGGGYQEIARMPVGQSINELAFSNDGKRLTILSGGPCPNWRPECPAAPRKVQTWDAIGYWEAINSRHDLAIDYVTFQSGDKAVRTVANGHGVVRVLNTTNGQEVTNPTLDFSKQMLHNAAATPDGRYTVTTNENRWYVWDVIERRSVPVAPPNVEVDHFERPLLSRDASLLTFTGKPQGSSEASLFVYKRNGSSYVPIQSFPLGCNTTTISVSSDMNYVAAVCSGKGIQIHDATTGKDRTPEGLKAMKDIEVFWMTPDGRHVVVRGEAESLTVWSLDSNKRVAEMHGHGHLVNFDLANDHLIAWYEHDPIQVFRIRTGRKCDLESNGEFSGTAFSVDEKLFAVADFTGLVRVADTVTCTEIAQFQPETLVNRMTFSKDGKYLAAGTSFEGGDYQPRADEQFSLVLWLLRPKDLIDEACERLKGLQPVSIEASLSDSSGTCRPVRMPLHR